LERNTPLLVSESHHLSLLSSLSPLISSGRRTVEDILSSYRSADLMNRSLSRINRSQGRAHASSSSVAHLTSRHSELSSSNSKILDGEFPSGWHPRQRQQPEHTWRLPEVCPSSPSLPHECPASRRIAWRRSSGERGRRPMASKMNPNSRDPQREAKEQQLLQVGSALR
jgi:hypothetical protein